MNIQIVETPQVQISEVDLAIQNYSEQAEGACTLRPGVDLQILSEQIADPESFAQDSGHTDSYD